MNKSKELSGGSRALSPDLDWSQVRETVLMLELSAGQIESAMRDSNSSVNVLSESFTTMAGYVHAMSASLASLPNEGELGATKESLSGMAEQVSGMVNHTIVAFQFYDKLVQRLDHVCHSLSLLGGLVADTLNKQVEKVRRLIDSKDFKQAEKALDELQKLVDHPSADL
jgi:hypothetical protein